jgi:hypothetical protein
MVFAETSLTDNIQDSIDDWVQQNFPLVHKDSNKELTKDIGKELKRYGYKKIPHDPLFPKDIQEKIMSALENGSEIIHYGLNLSPSSSIPIVLTSGVSRDNLGIDYLCEIQRWDDEGDADDLETSLLFADDLLARMGLDYEMKQVVGTNRVLNLVKTWIFDNDADDTTEWWVKEPFSLFQPFNTLWPEWFVKEIESNTKV